VTINKPVRINHLIRVPQVRVIGSDGQQIGVMETREAISLAASEGLDLVEVSPVAKPPVCRIIDYGKYKYEQAKKAKDAKKKQHVFQVKEIRLRPKTDDHDYQFKVKHAENFLIHKDKVKVTVMFRGRESTHQEFGRQLLERFCSDLSGIAGIETPIRVEGRDMTMILSPR
jgi:translation initiation factor IF-3